MERSSVDTLVARRLGLQEIFSRSELEQAQLRIFKKSLSYLVHNSGFYRQHFSGIDPESLDSYTDLQQLPFLSPEEVRSEGHRMLCVSQSRVARVVTMQTSGSTGKPKRFSFTRKDLAATSDFFLQGMLSLVSTADRVLVLLPCEQEAGVGKLLLDALNDGGIQALGLWPPRPQELVKMVAGHGISCLVGLPQHLLEASMFLDQGTLRSMLLCSDYAPPSLRRRIEENCGCESFLHYGATESGLGGAVECSHHDGCHIRESELLVEIIDPGTGRQLEDGQEGEVVLTTLGREAMGLVRYRTGDLASLERSLCPCGGVTARLKNIRGRAGGCHLRSGALLLSQDVDDSVFATPNLLDYRIRLVHADTDRLEIEYLAVPGTPDLDESLGKALLKVEAIRREVALEGLEIGHCLKVASFGADHTQKRTILDQRRPGEEERYALCY